ncbi:metal-sensitive transcriptional regulator [Tumebacillus permanentifrigoris]|uniref:DNA-binding FrmR family transcriptional regulator n=1 Tax=Tumebacillus permanentifrigoris TaxID=378543 RepID=A0A316DAF6_9BACL|nr:metal-sensitive transcriptional regulator [Tumebacillus permanentifrigoris]PWK14481.1 DNA-binding FrmR family transcriptional regulator [Tumebacillus permanentifrigoris]
MHQSERDKETLIKNLRKIEGQIRGVQKMIEDDRYCIDILVQLAAIKSASHKIGLKLLESHTRGCVTTAIRDGGGDDHIAELMDVMRVFTK